MKLKLHDDPFFFASDVDFAFSEKIRFLNGLSLFIFIFADMGLMLLNPIISMNQKKITITLLTIKGLVQGVGFRPFVYRIATEMGIRGEVDNRNNGVFIRAILSPELCTAFLHRIRTEHPPVASIHSVSVDFEEAEDDLNNSFRICASRSVSEEITQISPDIAVCDACLADRKHQPHRIGYPFINCTHCGPRFTIIRDLPYDRQKTTMSAFALCPECSTEYQTVADRRFHAQPVACNACGPIYYAYSGDRQIRDYAVLLEQSLDYIRRGEVIAVKGTGGYHLVCDATQAAAVKRMRVIKHRDNKPFAVMFGSLQTLKNYARTNSVEEEQLLSWRRPIVLLEQTAALPESVNPGYKTLGCMLPYMPIHYDWFEKLHTPVLVMTSGNLSELPITISPEEAERELRGLVPFILHHNREIYNRADDSVLQICGDTPCLIRRSRGFVPEPFFADVETEGILAFGAEKTASFALGKGETIIQSQYIGDLKNWETYRFYAESLERFTRLFRFRPEQLVCDLHPDYFSSKEALHWAEKWNLPLLSVQHHHAHAAACMLEYRLHDPVIALVLDGTGLGDDGHVWGGEVFYCDRKGYERLAHLDYVPMPGGDKAAQEPWRMAVAYLWYYLGDKATFPEGFKSRIGAQKIDMLIRMMQQKVNSPLTSGAGRLFDAIASLLGVCDVASHQAEAPVRLEQLADDELNEHYTVVIEGAQISLRFMLEGILQDLQELVPLPRIAARFHNTLAQLLTAKALSAMHEKQTNRVVISGGCFQNKRLTQQLQRLFAEAGVPLFVPSAIPCNDAGIAIGQLAIAAANR